jgi:serine/threonine-protein kinase
VGASTANALKALKAVGLSGKEVGREFSDTVPKGAVIRSDPAAGAVVNKGTEVKFVTSDGPPPVPVPNVTDKKLSDAQQILAAAGFKVSVNKPPLVILNRVISQSPGGGNTAPRGSTVTITVI